MARKKSVESAQLAAPNAETTADPIAGDAVCYADANLDVQHIEEARSRILAALAAGAPVTVDLSRIASIDTSGVQLLLALANEARKRGAELQLVGESAALTKALDVLGLRGTLDAAQRHAAH